MTRFSKDSKYRLRDFKKRGSCGSEGGDIYHHEKLTHSYIPIHPLADDLDILEKLDLAKESCTWVDAYWNMGTDVSFIQVISKENTANNLEVGLYAQWGNTIKECLTLTSIIEEAFITKSIFEQQMNEFISLGILPSEALRRKLGRLKLKL